RAAGDEEQGRNHRGADRFNEGNSTNDKESDQTFNRGNPHRRRSGIVIFNPGLSTFSPQGAEVRRERLSVLSQGTCRRRRGGRGRRVVGRWKGAPEGRRQRCRRAGRLQGRGEERRRER